MINWKSIFFVSCSLLIITSCGDDEDDRICDNVVSEFESIFQGMISNGHADQTTFDTEIHEYSFVLTADKEVCEIGYQSQPEIASTPYLIEVIDNSNNTTLYSESHVFSSSAISYVAPTSSINLQSGVSYTLRRVQADWGPFITYTIGRLARRDTMNFPYSSGVMTIESSDFYQNGGPLSNLAVPYIDLVFK